MALAAAVEDCVVCGSSEFITPIVGCDTLGTFVTPGEAVSDTSPLVNFKRSTELPIDFQNKSFIVKYYAEEVSSVLPVFLNFGHYPRVKIS